MTEGSVPLSRFSLDYQAAGRRLKNSSHDLQSPPLRAVID
jgi:hypothetical protein